VASTTGVTTTASSQWSTSSNLKYPYAVLPGGLGGVETNMAEANGVVYVPVVDDPEIIENANDTAGTESIPKGTGEMVAIDAKAGKAGKDTFVFTNKSSVPHNFTILQGTKTIGATPTFAGGVKLLTVTLAARKHTFECTVPGHAAAGMKGTLTVN
jgi:plastocyanin